MSESSVDLIATVGAVLAFLFAAAAGITSRRGIRLVAIGAVFLWLPLISEVRRTWINVIARSRSVSRNDTPLWFKSEKVFGQ
jgi:hypothetical protein